MSYETLGMGITAGLTAAVATFLTTAVVEYFDLCRDVERWMREGNSRDEVYKLLSINVQNANAAYRPIIRRVRSKYCY